jgi:digeranylgeranylglycerophospholipid reductase
MKPEYDAIVVGAGVAGCMAATTLGIHAKGMRILLVDRNPKTEPGKKTTQGWICGDAVGEHHVKFVHERLGITFGPPEIENRVDAVFVCSPNRRVRHPFEGSGFLLDRPKFAHRLLNEAQKTGIEYHDLTQAVGLLTEGNFVTGIVCQDQGGEQPRSSRITSKLVIDASGMSTVLRRNLNIASHIEKEIDKDDVEPTIRMIAKLADGSKVDTSRCEIYLDAERAPGGYMWMFPKSSSKVNLGLGVQQKRSGKPLDTLLKEWIAETPVFRGLTPLTDSGNLPGAWPVSVRHQNDSLVANGFMIVGDAGWFPNPISAGGIGPSMTGGVIAGEVAASALQAGDVSEASMWQYNTRYVEKYGNKTAALEAFRIYLQTLDNSELNYGMRNFVTNKEAVAFTWGEVPEVSIGDKIVKAALGLRKFSAFRNLAFSVSKMNLLNRLYSQYPETPSRFSEWKKEVAAALSEVRARFR